MIRRVILRNIPLWQSVRPLTVSAKCNNNAEKSENLTHFGFETVKSSEKADKGKTFLMTINISTTTLISVHKVFENVAESYDLMNDAMSMGIHRVWKDILLERFYPTQGTKLLDVAGGTGRSIRILRSS